MGDMTNMHIAESRLHRIIREEAARVIVESSTLAAGLPQVGSSTPARMSNPPPKRIVTDSIFESAVSSLKETFKSGPVIFSQGVGGVSEEERILLEETRFPRRKLFYSKSEELALAEAELLLATARVNRILDSVRDLAEDAYYHAHEFYRE